MVGLGPLFRPGGERPDADLTGRASGLGGSG